jgi:gamma-glutamylcyclotransferase (GGCT)/AIG2-like uncharacterized protein YtfP
LEPSDLLFVYGTLRPGFSGEGRRLVHDLEAVGEATVRGTLYDVGDYPGMILGDGLVRGDVVRVPTRQRFEALDAYEECDASPPLFRRVLTTARCRDASEKIVWVYTYARSIAGKARIHEGDYAAWRARG